MKRSSVRSNLTAREVRERTLTPTRFREGYEVDRVDAFMELVAQTLEAYASGAPGLRPLRADEVKAKKFQATKFRPGYDQDDVDDLLDLAEAALRVLESTYRPAGAPGVV